MSESLLGRVERIGVWESRQAHSQSARVCVRALASVCPFVAPGREYGDLGPRPFGKEVWLMKFEAESWKQVGLNGRIPVIAEALVRTWPPTKW